MEVTVSRKAHFNAAHRLFNKNWSDEKNESVFGDISCCIAKSCNIQDSNI